MPAARALLAYECFAIAAPGLEPVVARELAAIGAALGVSAVKEVPGGVEFAAGAEGLAAAQLRLRAASRVVVRIASFRATAFHELERAARQVEWARFLAAGAAFRLRVTCRKSRLYHSDAVAERVAGAITRAIKRAEWVQAKDRNDDADETLPEDGGAEPSDAVSTRAGTPPRAPAAPPQLFIVRLDHDRCTISADASGELLHRRGYRLAVARAPLRETLAAAMVLAAEWDPATPLVDPMCGSGTIAIEAAMLARRIAPGLGRAFAAERWPETPDGTWRRAREQARTEIVPRAAAPIVGADRDEGAIAAARANAERTGVAGDIEFRVAALSALEPPAGRGLLIANPPYGIRVGETKPLRDLFARLGQVARERCDGWRVALLSADAALDAQVRLPFSVRFTSKNGGIPVRFVLADVDSAAAPPAKRAARHR